MAYFDHLQAEQERLEHEAFKNLIDEIKLSTNEHHKAFYYIDRMCLSIVNQNKKIEEYQKFFQTLSQLIPKQPSLSDNFG